MIDGLIIIITIICIYPQSCTQYFVKLSTYYEVRHHEMPGKRLGVRRVTNVSFGEREKKKKKAHFEVSLSLDLTGGLS